MPGVLYNPPQVLLCLPRAPKCWQEAKTRSQSARGHTQPRQGVKREVRPSRWLSGLSYLEPGPRTRVQYPGPTGRKERPVTGSEPSSSGLHMQVVVHIHTVNKYDRQTDRSLLGGADMGSGQQRQKEEWPSEMGFQVRTVRAFGT